MNSDEIKEILGDNYLITKYLKIYAPKPKANSADMPIITKLVTPS
jgi:hypothetical protein